MNFRFREIAFTKTKVLYAVIIYIDFRQPNSADPLSVSAVNVFIALGIKTKWINIKNS